MSNVAEEPFVLEPLRDEIDKLDRRLTALLLERIRLSKEVAERKEGNARPAYDPGREVEVINNVLTGVEDESLREALFHIYKEVISVCRNMQAPLMVFFLGPEGSFCHKALREALGSAAASFPLRDVEEVFEKASVHKGSLGVVPIENSIDGPIGQVYDLLRDSDLVIQREIFLPVKLALLSGKGGQVKPKRIYSHPTAFAQVRAWIGENFPSLEPVEVFSTSHAALLASKDIEALAISSKDAASIYDLKVLVEEIPLRGSSWTRFVVVGRGLPKRTGNDKTSIYFTLPHRPGTLKRALEAFSDEINLCLIFSRPIKGKKWEYGFFLDMEGHLQDPLIENALNSLRKRCVDYKFLGSYPRGWKCL